MKAIVSRLFLLMGLAVLPAGAEAHSGATGVVKHRMDAMEDMRDHLKALVAMVKRQAPFDAAEVEQRGSAIAADLREVPELFPEGSATGKSEAAPEIWRNWKDFVAQARRAADKAAALRPAADGDRESYAGAVAALAETCKSCHDTYRLDD